ncbi:SIMPL domain-containing protein [Sphingomonas crusticola]|uniref:SIMPL domain-containing protein n=1 Tax=Sphingomonas crusticola TaxID=1697973 RepID=UPI000E2307A9|nr:SIMPL domain-containing protein [Sphingomonas crusticola]
MKILLPLALLAATPALADVTTTPIAGTELDVSATGIATRTPDLMVINAGVVTQANKAGEAMRANAAAMTTTEAALKRAGVADRDIQTQSINLQPQYRYGDNVPPVLTGYQASNRVSVRLRDLNNAGSVLDALVAAGANQIDGPTLSVDRPESALDEARAKALAIARTRAELYAKAAGLRVRRIVRISESDGAPPVVRPMMMSRAKAADATPVEAGEQELTVTLSVVFELN